MSKKIKDEELEAPVMPGEINRDAVTAAGKNLSMAKGVLNNMSYDTFKQGSIYDGLRRSYEQQGKTAMKDVLGQVAARTGGMASSYAVSAANQSYNNYMKGLEDAARAMYNEEYAKNRDKVDLAQQEYNNAYGEYRDDKADAWTRYNAENDAYWKNKNYNYQVGNQQKQELYNLIMAGGTPNRADFPDISDSDWNTIFATATNTYKANNKTSYLDGIEENAAAGITQTYDPNNPWGVTEEEFNNAVGIGTNQYKSSAGYLSNQKATDDSIRSMLTSESFDWDTYDWNGDAEGLGSAADYFAGKGSAYDSGYWQGIYNDAQQGYADADIEAAQDEVIEILKAGGIPDTKLLIDAGWLTADDTVTDENNDGVPDEIPAGLTGAARTLWQNNIDSENNANTKEAHENAVDDIKARIANGESLEDIAKDYKIETGGRTWEEVTGMSQAEWQQLANEQADNELKDLISSHTPESIAMRFAAENTDLSEDENKVLDYYYGTGTAEAAKNFVNSKEFKAKMTDLGENHHQLQHVEEFYKLLPDKIPEDIIYTYIERYYPKAFKNLREYSPKE
jgi:hypothetical protein